MTAYRVYDDEWEQLMGCEQLKEFAIYRLAEDSIFNEDELLSYEDDYKHMPEIVSIIKQYENGETFDNIDIPIDVLIEILNLACFEVEKIELR